MTDVTKIPDEQGQEAVRVAAAYQAQVALEQAATRNADLAPLRALVNAESFDSLVDGIESILKSGTFAGDLQINPQLQAAFQILPSLKRTVT